MVSTQNRLILWTGPKHSGKTTGATKLAQIASAEGFNVAGLLSPSLYRNSKLLGFDVLDLHSQTRAPLARRKTSQSKAGPFTFIADGLKLGNAALSAEATKSADLVIVDEFGPLELNNEGWRKNVDSLLISSNAVVLLVVRRELADTVRQVYANVLCQELAATEGNSIDEVITMLKNRRHHIEGPRFAGTKNMFKLDGMLMIGSAGSNVGKTELGCTLLKKFCKTSDIIGIKVTTIKDKDGQCPRGGEGCGVCSSLEGVYCITEETDSSSGKDTARLLSAGASRVFWLRVLKEHLQEGITALLDIIGPDAVSICESNSLRQVVEPGLFLMVRNRNLKIWKSSAQQVKKYANRIVVSDGSRFDFDLDRIKLLNNKWTLQIKATAIIMAGGGSSRMGTDKSMLPIKGQSMIEAICEQLRGSFDQILISANEVDKFAFLGFEVVPDKVPEQGPLMGIASALEASANELNFVIACDIPKINLSCVNRMLTEAVESQADIVIPTTRKREVSKTKKRDTRYEPLFAIYRKSALEVINKALSSGKRKITDVFTLCTVKYIELDDTNWLVNLNTMADYEEFQKKMI
ncbi:MAG TPA: NTP transferase domain-containing protein [Sedimentisphaerales bacterium]|nr:NTP transferase domain-containing protein [Sedimentisphaerales bacterium]